MKKEVKPSGYWTKDRCVEDAKNYETISEWKNNSGSAYATAGKNGWREDCHKHMKRKSKPIGYWTKERCLLESLKFNTISSFEKKSRGAFAASKRHGCYEDCCKHMKKLGNLYRRTVYAYEFDNNSVYVGLTCDVDRRKWQHLNNKTSAVFKHIKNTNSKFSVIILTDIIDVEEAKIKEKFYLSQYKSSGWKVLNVAKTGGVGGATTIWTYEECKRIALVCEYKKELFTKYVGCYNAAKTHGWLKDICSHMKPLHRELKWKFEDVQREALKYKHRNDFKKGSTLAYNAAVNSKWLPDVCKHMMPPRSKHTKWTFENCKNLCEVSNCKTRVEFEKKHGTAYTAMRKKGWLDILLPKRIKRLKWTYVECAEEAKKFTSRFKFKMGNSGAYQASLKNKWLDDFYK